MTVLLVAEHNNAALKRSTRHAHAAAIMMGMFADGELHVLVVGKRADRALAEAVQMTGVSKVLYVETPNAVSDSGANVEAAVSRIADRYSHIVFAETTFGKHVATRIAAQLQVVRISGVTAVISAETFQRSCESERTSDAVRNRDPIKIVTICTTAFEPISSDAGCGVIEQIVPKYSTNSVRTEPSEKRAIDSAVTVGVPRNILSCIERLASKQAAVTSLCEKRSAHRVADAPSRDITHVISLVHDLELHQLDRNLLTEGSCALKHRHEYW